MRYTRNKNTISESEQTYLDQVRVCVVGCGGLGGYVIEELGRIGIGHITAIDGDVFDETNLNRQILSEMSLIGTSKALAAKDRMNRINPNVVVTPVYDFLTQENAHKLLSGHEVVVDALDQIATRLLLQEACEQLAIPMVHGAIAGWYGQVATVLPGDRTLSKIYKNPQLVGQEKKLGNPAFTPAIIASMEVAEVIKIVLGKGELLRHQMLHLNMLEHDYERIYFEEV